MKLCSREEDKCITDMNKINWQVEKIWQNQIVLTQWHPTNSRV